MKYMSHDERKNYNQMLLTSRECHYCGKIGHLKRSCRKYLKKVKEKQIQTEKKKESIEQCWKKLMEKCMNETNLMIKSLHETVSSLKNQILKQNNYIKQQEERLKTQPYLTSDFFVDLMTKSIQVMINKNAQIIYDQSSEQESSSSSEEELMVFGPRYTTISTSKNKDKTAQTKFIQQEKDPSSKKKGKQNNRKKSR